jgi:hypothetical protein
MTLRQSSASVDLVFLLRDVVRGAAVRDRETLVQYALFVSRCGVVVEVGDLYTQSQEPDDDAQGWVAALMYCSFSPAKC